MHWPGQHALDIILTAQTRFFVSVSTPYTGSRMQMDNVNLSDITTPSTEMLGKNFVPSIFRFHPVSQALRHFFSSFIINVQWHSMLQRYRCHPEMAVSPINVSSYF